jgi:hypothetical protein
VVSIAETMETAHRFAFGDELGGDALTFGGHVAVKSGLFVLEGGLRGDVAVVRLTGLALFVGQGPALIAGVDYPASDGHEGAEDQSGHDEARSTDGACRVVAHDAVKECGQTSEHRHCCGHVRGP